MRIFFTLIPIAGLLFLGLLIALNSGAHSGYGKSGDRNMLAANASGLAVRLFGLLAGIAVVHVLIGYPIAMSWLR